MGFSWEVGEELVMTSARICSLVKSALLVDGVFKEWHPRNINVV